MPRTPAGETRERVYRFMRERLMAGEPPTLREIQSEFGFRAVETAREHLRELVEAGKLEQAPGRARGYRLPERERREVSGVQLIPMLGRVQAGALTTAVEELEAWVPVQSRHRVESLFALRVRGESMLNAGILPGDIVIVSKDASVANGDIVVALVEDEATVKRWRRTGARVELHPENPAFDVIVRRVEEVHLLGKVIEVRRHLETLLAAHF
ncbi:MAG TPA: transcriptional repressor LexA [Polyangiales bacterium]|nr:transcriptional repressor LexA [Polyangiales bacterium]